MPRRQLGPCSQAVTATAISSATSIVEDGAAQVRRAHLAPPQDLVHRPLDVLGRGLLADVAQQHARRTGSSRSGWPGPARRCRGRSRAPARTRRTPSRCSRRGSGRGRRPAPRTGRSGCRRRGSAGAGRRTARDPCARRLARWSIWISSHATSRVAAPRLLLRRLQEQPVGVAHHVGLVPDRDLLAAVRARVLEREPHDPPRPAHADRLDGDARVRRGARYPRQRPAAPRGARRPRASPSRTRCPA